MADTMRAFIACEFPKNIISAIGKVQENLRSYGLKVRWIRPENMHLTLKFLGNIERTVAQRIAGTISESVKGCGPISISAKGIGVFPTLKRPRILWAGLAGGNDALRQLHRNLESNLERIGFPKENKHFKGHLTLGRFRGKADPKQLIDAIEAFEGFKTEAFVIDHLILFKSELLPAGPLYSKLTQVTF